MQRNLTTLELAIFRADENITEKSLISGNREEKGVNDGVLEGI